MRTRGLVLFLPLLALAGTPGPETRKGAIVSPSGDRSAYLESAMGSSSIVILDRKGQPIQTLRPHLGSALQGEPCLSKFSFAWAGDGAIGVECHINPSLSEYVELDIATGNNTRDLLGYDFTPSPDHRFVAHAGWISHFAPPYAQSNCLQVDRTTIYPLPQGMKPVEQIGLTEPPQVVRKIGSIYSGIHEIERISWSPDSRLLALFDCTYDWTPNHPESLSGGDGEESGRRCALAVVSLDGKVKSFALPESSREELQETDIAWQNPREITLRSNSATRTFKMPATR